jgi:hypothetical protein
MTASSHPLPISPGTVWHLGTTGATHPDARQRLEVLAELSSPLLDPVPRNGAFAFQNRYSGRVLSVSGADMAGTADARAVGDTACA